MTDFDAKLHSLLSAEDEAFVTDTIDEKGYYKTALNSLRGEGSGMRLMAWAGILIFSSLLIFAIWKFFHVTTTREQIMFASMAIMMNSAQIALKIWFNMQLDRRVIVHEIKRLHLAIAAMKAS